MTTQWKEVVRTLLEMHEEYGSAVVGFDGEIPDPDQPDPTLLTPESDLFRASELTPKKVRGWLWHHRKADWSEPHPLGVLFSAVDTDTDETVIGIARIPEPDDDS